MRRRQFLCILCGATAVSSFAGYAQQRSIPVIGYLNGAAPFEITLEAFRKGLAENGYVEGQNVTIEYRWAEGEYDRLPTLAAELVKHDVDVIVASGGDLAAQAAKAATSSVPIVFTSGDDPVVTGLVASLARPSSNLTGVSFFVVELHAKRFELLCELVPRTKVVGLLVNPASPQTERVVRSMQQAATDKGIELQVLTASTANEIDAAFSVLGGLHADALIQQADPFFVGRRQQFALLAARHTIPTIYEGRQFIEAGGLVSYGPSLSSVYHQIGSYVGKILKGERVSELPVVQPTKFELVVNLIAARAIGLKVAESFLSRADEVIE